MTEHKYTDDEITRALECCSRNVPLLNSCEDCPFYGKRCAAFLPQVALDLINRQKAEIERIHRHTEMYHEVKAEAIKEFAERLKATAYVPKPYGMAKVIDMYNIDNLVKEMTEEQK